MSNKNLAPQLHKYSKHVTQEYWDSIFDKKEPNDLTKQTFEKTDKGEGLVELYNVEELGREV